MQELYKQQTSELDLLIKSREDLEKQISSKVQDINQTLGILVGKFFKWKRPLCGWGRSARVGPDSYPSRVNELHGICMVLRADIDSVYIQEYCEQINEVTPYNRLTFECSFKLMKTSEFLNKYQDCISLEEFTSSIKYMQNRDSYCCWHTTLRVQ